MTSIKEVAEKFQISPHRIRFYEKEGLISIPRDEHGNRSFDQKSLSRLRAILYYRRLDLSVSAIRDLMADFHNHDKSLHILREKLDNLELKLKELEETKSYVKEKIALHELLAELSQQGKTRSEQEAAYQQFMAKRQ